MTENVKDFAAPAAAPYDIVVDQDKFLIDQLNLASSVVVAALRRQISRYRREPRTVDDLLDVLSSPGQGCSGFAAACRKLL